MAAFIPKTGSLSQRDNFPSKLWRSKSFPKTWVWPNVAKFDPNQRKGFESTWMSLSGPKYTWFCLPLGLQNLPIPEFSSLDQLIQRKSVFSKHIGLPYPRVVVLQCCSPFEIFAQVKSAQKLQGVITLYFTRSRCRNDGGSSRNRRMGTLTRKFVIYTWYPCGRWNVWQNYYHCVFTGFLEHFCFLLMVFHQFSTCTSTLTLIQVGIFQDQCGKLSFIWMAEQCALGTACNVPLEPPSISRSVGASISEMGKKKVEKCTNCVIFSQVEAGFFFMAQLFSISFFKTSAVDRWPCLRWPRENEVSS